MSDPTKTELAHYITPFKRQDVLLSSISHENGLNLLEIKVREGRRFTMLEIDPEIASEMAAVLQKWVDDNKQD